MIKQPIYEVTYILHSIVSETETHTKEVSHNELMELLNNGLVSLIKAERIFKD